MTAGAEPPSRAELDALAARCWRSPVEFGRIFLPNWFPTKMPWVHRGILAMIFQRTDFLLDFGPEVWRDDPHASWTPNDLQKILTNFMEEVGIDPDTRKPILRPIFTLEEVNGHPHLKMEVKDWLGFIMPRGFSKTTIVNMADLIFLLYEKIDFFLYVSEAGHHAERQLLTLRKILEENELIKLVFKSLAAGRQSSNKWTDSYIEPLNGVQVGAVGRGGQIRGFSKDAKRPGMIIYDDLENSESVKSDTQRPADANWFFQTALPTIRKGGRNIIIGTLLHTDAILNKVMRDPRFTVVRFGAIDRQGDALWEWQKSLEEIEALQIAMTGVGEAGGFYLEYMSEFRDDGARMFPLAKLVFVTKGKELFIGMSLACDPAISENPKADFCSFAVCGIEAGGHKHIADYFGKVGMDPAEQVDKFFELHFKWLAHLPPEFRKHGIEAVAYQRALIHLVKAEQFQRSRLYGTSAYFDIVPILHGKTGKIPRVQGILKPLIHAGYLSFDMNWPDLTDQLINWPNGKKDGPDVCSMSVGLLDPYVSLNLSEDMTDMSADRARPLEDVLEGSFRSAP